MADEPFPNFIQNEMLRLIWRWLNARGGGGHIFSKLFQKAIAFYLLFCYTLLCKQELHKQPHTKGKVSIMLFNTLIATLNSVKDNEVFYLQYQGNLEKSLKATVRKSGHTLTKVTETLVLKGIEYSSQKSVQHKVADGKVLTNQLPWGEWDSTHKNIINHKGNKYVRLYYPDGNLIGDKDYVGYTKFFYDGVEVDRQFLKDNDLMIDSFFKPHEVTDAMTINVENIVEIH